GPRFAGVVEGAQGLLIAHGGTTALRPRVDVITLGGGVSAPVPQERLVLAAKTGALERFAPLSGGEGPSRVTRIGGPTSGRGQGGAHENDNRDGHQAPRVIDDHADGGLQDSQDLCGVHRAPLSGQVVAGTGTYTMRSPPIPSQGLASISTTTRITSADTATTAIVSREVKNHRAVPHRVRCSWMARLRPLTPLPSCQWDSNREGRRCTPRGLHRRPGSLHARVRNRSRRRPSRHPSRPSRTPQSSSCPWTCCRCPCDE